MRRTALLAAALAAIPITALAQGQAPTPPPPPGGALTPEGIVAARRSGFLMSAGVFTSIKATADAGGDVKQLAVPARTLARWARTMPTMFPAGTNLESSRAMPEVWSNPADFQAKATAYFEAAHALADAAQAGDRAAFLQRWTALGATCAACHDTYRSPS